MLDEGYPEFSNKNNYIVNFYIPQQTGVVKILAELLFQELPKESEKLIWFTDWPFYKPYEMKMLECFRKAHGGTEWLIKTPGHLFRKKENLDALACFIYAPLFLWDCYVLTNSNKQKIFISHDEIGLFITENKKTFQRILNLVNKMDIKIPENKK